jgi:hypothetical protein
MSNKDTNNALHSECHVLFDNGDLRLSSGEKVWIDLFHMKATYLGLLAGRPSPESTQQEGDGANSLVKDYFNGPTPVFLDQKYCEGGWKEHRLPNRCYCAQLRSTRLLVDDTDGSWLNVIWFGSDQKDMPLNIQVANAMADLDWDAAATAYSY